MTQPFISVVVPCLNEERYVAACLDSILATNKIIRHERAIDPGQHVIVQRVHLAEGGTHFANLDHEAGGKRG